MSGKESSKSSLHIQRGISKPESLNPDKSKLSTKRKADYSARELAEGILEGNRSLLSMAITLIESTLPAHQDKAQEVIDLCISHSGKAIRVGITGIPGVGKSTFIEALGMHVIREGGKVAVLAIDPSSQRTRGSILGDKTRMEQLANNPKAFIRPSPSAGSLGGVARKTRETIILCEAAGFDTIFVETVGVGQSETSVHSMVDFFLLLMLAGAGDELQGIKRGIMEMMDMMVINKADENPDKAELAANIYRNALHLFPSAESGVTPVVQLCSSIKKTGIDQVWQTILDYCDQTRKSGYFYLNRKNQSRHWLYETIQSSLSGSFFSNETVREALPDLEKNVVDNRKSPFQAATELIQKFRPSEG